MKTCRQVLIYLVVTAMAMLPLTRMALAQEAGSRTGGQQVTASQPRMLATAEVEIPAEKKPGIGKYIVAGVLGVALVALVAGGGGGGGGGDGSTSTGDTGAVEVGW